MKPLSLLVAILILVSGLNQPPANCAKKSAAKYSCMMKHQPHKDGCGNKDKRNASNTSCNFCVLCIAFVVPVKPGIQRNFVSGIVEYPEMVQNKLTDFSSSQWRPPNA